MTTTTDSGRSWDRIWQPAKRAAVATTTKQLRCCLELARYRAADAAAMPWPALAASWQREAEAIQRLIEQRTGGCDAKRNAGVPRADLTEAKPMTNMELQARFNAITAHYSGLTRHMVRSDEWGIDPYAWDAPGTGIAFTPIELALWEYIRLENVVMYPQLPVGRFFVDFGNPAAKVAIECDGAQWHTDWRKDEARDRELDAMGWKVYRITGRDCVHDDIEFEGEDGRDQMIPGRARLFIRDVCSRHQIQRLIKTDRGPRQIGVIASARWWADNMQAGSANV